MPSPSADDEALTGAKQLLRRAVRQRRAVRPAEQRAADDLARFDRLTALLAPEREPVVACYLGTGDEPGTTRLVGWLAAQDVPVLLPLVGRADGAPRRRPDWAWYTGPDGLRSGPRGIPEPDARGLGARALASASVVVCPALAGTARGERLGTGAGWYDRALREARPDAVTIMLLNDDEVLPTLPTQAWDRRMDLVVTPTRVLRAG
ncbi:5-formyltetrahydrofolate cyclo-ligase [Desertihabitans brevis]|uniref:5-formyltetrahydrofolate cyclo-ligase n=1 Tax=Desertihabitans brevis TaxID=2268447 RepID=UPI001313F198|nr:5-formyltetrahydrofolate cyclo-ligase [Desertihabitans brevis]